MLLLVWGVSCRDYTWEENMKIIIIVFIIMTNIYETFKAWRCQAGSLTNDVALNPMSYTLFPFYR